MRAEELSEEIVQAGRRLMNMLDEFELRPEVVAWVKYSDDNVWNLAIGTAAVDTVGPSR